MIGRLLSHLMGNVGSDEEGAEDPSEQLREQEEGGWIIVDLAENGPIGDPDAAPLEPPSRSVYQRCALEEEEEEEEEEPLGPDEDICRAPPQLTWGVWGVPPRCNVHLLTLQRARSQTERKKLGRRALHRQNLAKARLPWADRCYGHSKQPCQRLYNY
ncbi:uncharacterized protein si:ch211-260e23.9 [Takifugu flavidus]|nr:uncharacterized protein si:ch211-260e23.9 [Takifugu flavidus]XP_056869182.1 uncharacterized protein si:ch211-260e23.9 [Takifugu flavidus]XP_056869191.1 uncharacterized protein si:ch211-260e23.9 [Takifugu flavidus]TNM90485.1 hypothetical protein fugu_002774 [Takifugu bimaculatus]